MGHEDKHGDLDPLGEAIKSLADRLPDEPPFTAPSTYQPHIPSTYSRSRRRKVWIETADVQEPLGEALKGLADAWPDSYVKEYMASKRETIEVAAFLQDPETSAWSLPISTTTPDGAAAIKHRRTASSKQQGSILRSPERSESQQAAASTASPIVTTTLSHPWVRDSSTGPYELTDPVYKSSILRTSDIEVEAENVAHISDPEAAEYTTTAADAEDHQESSKAAVGIEGDSDSEDEHEHRHIPLDHSFHGRRVGPSIDLRVPRKRNYGSEAIAESGADSKVSTEQANLNVANNQHQPASKKAVQDLLEHELHSILSEQGQTETVDGREDSELELWKDVERTKVEMKADELKLQKDKDSHAELKEEKEAEESLDFFQDLVYTISMLVALLGLAFVVRGSNA